MPKKRRPGEFTLKRIKVRNGDATYFTYRVEGQLNGDRIRKNFKDREEAVGEKLRLEIAAANGEGDVVPRNTALSAEQLREAEAAFKRLGDQSLLKAVDFFLTEYREPGTDKTLREILTIFLAEEIGHRAERNTISPLVAANYKNDLTRFIEPFGDCRPHEVTTERISEWMAIQLHPDTDTAGRQLRDEEGKPVLVHWGKKRWNNFRGILNPFFKWMMAEPRGWIASNPVAAVRRYSKKDLDAAEPVILSVERCKELMSIVEGYREGAMVPYFALCLFAGLRPSTREGEAIKLGQLENVEKLIDVERAHIRVPKNVAKGRFVRGVDMQPNLVAWLKAYPLDKFPIAPKGFESMVEEIRRKARLSHDVMRHTFISMLVEKLGSVQRVAIQAGNSEQMIRDHYLNLVRKAEAARFWEIGPISRGSASQFADLGRVNNPSRV